MRENYLLSVFDRSKGEVKMKCKCLLLSLVLIIGSSNIAFAGGDATLGKKKSATCALCHGSNGISTKDNYPNLAGQKEAYLVKALTDFRSGSRKDPLMSNIAKSLSDDDINNLAAYFNSLK